MDYFDRLVLDILLQEARVSWKTIKKEFLNKVFEEEEFDEKARSIGFNNFQEFYEDVYETLYKDDGGKKYEPSSIELIKIFKFLLNDPQKYEEYKNQLDIYGFYRYRGNKDVLDKLLRVKTSNEFETFLISLERLKDDDSILFQDEKVYSDSNVSIYSVDNNNEAEKFCDGTTWCIKQKNYFDLYTKGKSSDFYIVVSKKEWFEQKNGIRKKYALRLPKLLKDPNVPNIIKNVTFKEKEKIREYVKNVLRYDLFLTENLKLFYSDTLKEELDLLSYTFEEFVKKYKNTPEFEEKFKAYSNTIKKYVKLMDSEEDFKKYLKNELDKKDDQELMKNFSLLKKDGIGRALKKTMIEAAENREEIKNIIINMDETEFTNNNQTVKFLSFEKLPEPYHSMLEKFPPYQKLIEINELIDMGTDKLFNYIFSNAKEIKEFLVLGLFDSIFITFRPFIDRADEEILEYEMYREL